MSLSGLVSLHTERIDAAVRTWGHMLADTPSWDHPCHFFDATEETVRWIFTLDVLNHCFWPDRGEPAWTVRYGGSDWSGYWGLAASLKRAIEWKIPITDPAWLSGLTENDLARVFSGEGQIPLFTQRLMNLREAGSIILSECGGDILSLVADASGSAVRLVKEVAALFPSFRDQAVYKGRTVYLWKRAQIFAADVHAAFGGRRFGAFSDVEILTAFADYKLPQVLRELGIISYDPELSAAIDNMVFIDPGSEAEVEIRAATIVSVEEIRKRFHYGGLTVTSARVDGWLWQLGQMDIFRKRPYHRCRTVFY